MYIVFWCIIFVILEKTQQFFKDQSRSVRALRSESPCYTARICFLAMTLIAVGIDRVDKHVDYRHRTSSAGWYNNLLSIAHRAETKSVICCCALYQYVYNESDCCRECQLNRQAITSTYYLSPLL